MVTETKWPSWHLAPFHRHPMQTQSLSSLSDCHVQKVKSCSTVYATFRDQTVPDPALAAYYLQRRLSLAAALPYDMPNDPADLRAGTRTHHGRIPELYRGNLLERQQGGARRYLATMSIRPRYERRSLRRAILRCKRHASCVRMMGCPGHRRRGGPPRNA